MHAHSGYRTHPSIHCVDQSTWPCVQINPSGSDNASVAANLTMCGLSLSLCVYTNLQSHPPGCVCTSHPMTVCVIKTGKELPLLLCAVFPSGQIGEWRLIVQSVDGASWQQLLGGSSRLARNHECFMLCVSLIITLSASTMKVCQSVSMPTR